MEATVGDTGVENAVARCPRVRPVTGAARPVVARVAVGEGVERFRPRVRPERRRGRKHGVRASRFLRLRPLISRPETPVEVEGQTMVVTPTLVPETLRPPRSVFVASLVSENGVVVDKVEM